MVLMANPPNEEKPKYAHGHKTKMFPFIDSTWNVIIGCHHDCTFCFARQLVETKLQKLGGRYADGFKKPKLIEKELTRHFQPRHTVFVTDIGDAFGAWVPTGWIMRVLRHIGQFPDTRFLLLTKNPARYFEVRRYIPPNCLLGATIETNRVIPISKAPRPVERLRTMVNIPYPHRFISIEPIMDSDLDVMVGWMRSIKRLEMVAVGYDNHHNNLVEPSLEKTMQLIEELEKFTIVIRKTLREPTSNGKEVKNK